MTNPPTPSPRRFTGVVVIAGAVLAGNFVLFLLLYGLSFLVVQQWTRAVFPFICTLAAFPQDFFFNYLRTYPVFHIWWSVIMAASAIGLLLRSPLAREVFITANIIHGVVLGYLVFGHYGSADFLDYSFKLYLNLVVSGAYVGYLTLPEVRESFGGRPRWERFQNRVKLLRRRAAPADADGYFHLAQAYVQMGRFEDAVSFLHKAIVFRPEDADLYYTLGMTFVRQKKFDLALTALQESVRRNPLHPEAVYQLALAYRRQGCDDEAVPLLRKTAHLRPDDPAVYRELGECCAASGKSEDAVAAFKLAVALNPQDGYVSYRMGYVLFHELGRLKEAHEAFIRAAKYLNGNPDVHFQLGLLAQQRDQPRDAIHAFKEVLRRQEQHKQAHYQLGFAYAKIQDWDSARREWKLLRELDPELAETLRLMIP